MFYVRFYGPSSGVGVQLGPYSHLDLRHKEIHADGQLIAEHYRGPDWRLVSEKNITPYRLYWLEVSENDIAEPGS